MVLTDDIRFRIERLLREHRAQEKLRAHGLEPRRKVLLVGPPGCGKTMTASVLAGELRLPLYVLVLDRLITKFMGETAAKLRLVFDSLAEHRGVYLFDELDAIGGERSSGSDVGEIRRVLNSFLTFLEQDESQSLVMAATNHASVLDRALFRRFDDVVEYELPSASQIMDLFRIKLFAFAVGELDWDEAAKAAEGLSHADVSRACEAAAKEALLDDAVGIGTRMLVGALREKRGVQGRQGSGERAGRRCPHA
jgi:SpoVK/Ycf46/Vps4 family AAA+-type ATPase